MRYFTYAHHYMMQKKGKNSRERDKIYSKNSTIEPDLA